MAKYTIELRKLVNSGYNIFDDTWDTFVPEHKAVLCDKIIRRYWFYEIGSETPDRFKHYLNEQLSRIMPYYNQMYQSELLEIMPLVNHFMEGENSKLRELVEKRTSVNRQDLSNVRNIASSLEKATQGLLNGTGALKSNINSTWREDRDGESDRTIKEVYESSQDQGETWSEKDVTDSTEKLNGSETKHETMSDTTDGTKGIKSSGTTTTSSTQMYSDTPQAVINTSGQMTIENQYLTNYTRNNGNESTQGTQDETVHNTEERTTDGTLTRDDTRETDTTVDKSGERNIKTTQSSSTDTTDHETHSDDVTGSKDITRGDSTSHEQKTTGTEHSFNNGSEQTTQVNLGAQNDDSQDNESIKGTTLFKGFTVSQSELLNQYRQTFLNIDQEIIDALADNFMGVW